MTLRVEVPSSSRKARPSSEREKLGEFWREMIMYWLKFKVVEELALDFGLETVSLCYPGCHRCGDHGPEPPVRLPPMPIPLSSRLSKAGLSSADQGKAGTGWSF